MTAVIVPTLGSATLAACLDAIARLEPAPTRVIVVASGSRRPTSLPAGMELLDRDRRLGFAAAVNLGLAAAGDAATVAVLNDDAEPAPGWLGTLAHHLTDPTVAAVQGTVVDAGGLVDGRGIAFSCWGLAGQVDRGQPAAPETGTRPVVAVSATAALFSTRALAAVALADGAVLDPAFDSYHEDVDLGLRLHRLGFRASWVANARCRHTGSSSGRRLTWRHPWWLLANPWRVLAGNLTATALAATMPRVLAGELKAVASLTRRNPRTPLVAAAVTALLPLILARGLTRRTPGPRLTALPEVA